MNRKRWIALLLAMVMALGLVGCGGKTPDAAPDPEPDQSTDGAVTVTDMIGREVTVIPGSYQRVVCIGAGALRIYSYVGDAALLCGVGAAALAAKAAMGFGANLRRAEYEQVQRFSFANIDKGDMVWAIRRAVELYHGDPKGWKQLQKNAMTADFSWDKSAQEYCQIYGWVTGK